MVVRDISVKGEKLRYLAYADESELLLTGSVTGDTGAAGIIKVKGTYLHWIDNDGNERRAQGAATGDTGAAGLIWIKGTKVYYNDYSGNTRYLPAQATILATGSEGYISSGWLLSWDLAHDAASGSSTTTYIAAKTAHDRTPLVGGTDKWLCGRGFLFFDTSDYSGLTVDSATLKIYVTLKSEWDDGHADLHIVEGVGNEPLQGTDFGDQLPYVTSGGSIAYDDITVNDWNEITLNATGIGWINLSGTTKFCMKLIGDISDLEPDIDGLSTGNQVYARSSHAAGYEPQLILNFA